MSKLSRKFLYIPFTGTNPNIGSKCHPLEYRVKCKNMNNDGIYFLEGSHDQFGMEKIPNTALRGSMILNFKKKSLSIRIHAQLE